MRLRRSAHLAGNRKRQVQRVQQPRTARPTSASALACTNGSPPVNVTPSIPPTEKDFRHKVCCAAQDATFKRPRIRIPAARTRQRDTP